jgi:hypothetical protein
VGKLVGTGSLAAACHLAQSALSGVWWGSWTRKNIVRAKLYDALISPRTLDAIETAFFDNDEKECATELAQAADLVSSELQQRPNPAIKAHERIIESSEDHQRSPITEHSR